MPRITELAGYRFGIGEITIPLVDPKDGNTIHDALGQPKTQVAKQIVFFDQLGDQVKITLTDDARQELVRLLTGGVLIPVVQQTPLQ